MYLLSRDRRYTLPAERSLGRAHAHPCNCNAALSWSLNVQKNSGNHIKEAVSRCVYTKRERVLCHQLYSRTPSGGIGSLNRPSQATPNHLVTNFQGCRMCNATHADEGM
jgi:hypothetical protein